MPSNHILRKYHDRLRDSCDFLNYPLPAVPRDDVSPHPNFISKKGGKWVRSKKTICGRLFTKSIKPASSFLMKTIRHAVNVPGEMEPLLKERIQDSRSLSGYSVSLRFTDMLYLPKRPIAKAFANASWQQQRRAIENILTLRKRGWRGIDLRPHVEAVSQVEKVAVTGCSIISRKNLPLCGAQVFVSKPRPAHVKSSIQFYEIKTLRFYCFPCHHLERARRAHRYA